MTEITGRVAVVTGGASGIGRGIAEALIDHGARVVIADIDDDAVKTTAAEIGAHPAVTDVASASSVAALADATLSEFGRVDIVVNNAGIGPAGKVADLTLDDWQWMLGVNLWGVIHGIRVFLPHLIANPDGGHIVNTASMAIFNPLPGLGAYTASKMGVQGLSEVLAMELAADHPNVRVSILPPGPVPTNIARSLRHRPAGQHGALADIDMGDGEQAAALRWVEPRRAGEIVARAIRNNDLYAITHPEWWPRVNERVEMIHREFGRYPPML
jgi:NAD(P)-dependent dehydrogenase (short-subunit alcohol dehydrogenase family)